MTASEQWPEPGTAEWDHRNRQFRLSIIDGVLRGLERHAEVASVLSRAEDGTAGLSAVARLLDIPEVAAAAVLDTSFRRLTRQDRHRLMAERDQLRAQSPQQVREQSP